MNQESAKVVTQFLNDHQKGIPVDLDSLKRHYSTVEDDGSTSWDIQRMTTDFSGSWDGNYDGLKAESRDRDEIGMVILKAIIEHGSDANTRTTHGRTALQMTALSGDLEYCKELVDKGADVFAKDNDGETALSLARKWHNNPKDLTDIIAYLQTFGPEPTRVD